MIKGKTQTGFSFTIDEEVRDDMELLETITQLDAGNAQLLPAVIQMILGDEQKAKLYDHCRTKKGRVSAKKVMTEVRYIFEEIEKGESKTKN